MFFYLLLGLAFTVMFPFVTRRLFDQALPSGQYSNVVRLLLVLAAALVISSLANVRRSYLGRVRERLRRARELRTKMFDRMQVLPSDGSRNASRGTCWHGCSPTSGLSRRGCRRPSGTDCSSRCH